MTRRQLVDGLKQFGVTDPEAASRVIAGEGAEPARPESDRATAPPLAAAAPVRVPFTSKLRQDWAHALKRASLERQLGGERPHEIQEILEAALEPWLRAHGYLK